MSYHTPNPVYTFSTFLVSDLCFQYSSHLKSTLGGIAVLIFLKRWLDPIAPSLYWLSFFGIAFEMLYEVGEISPGIAFCNPLYISSPLCFQLAKLTSSRFLECSQCSSCLDACPFCLECPTAQPSLWNSPPSFKVELKSHL